MKKNFHVNIVIKIYHLNNLNGFMNKNVKLNMMKLIIIKLKLKN
jgi:hypothetical protein